MKKAIILSQILAIIASAGIAGAADKTVFIAAKKSEFKDAVISKVKTELEKDKNTVKLFEMNKALKEPVDSYGAVIIVNTCMAWQVEGKVKKFLKKLSDTDKKKVILFTTVGGEDWAPKGTGVDFVTSASKIAKADTIALVIIAKTKSILAK